MTTIKPQSLALPVLDRREEEHGTCYLCRMSLYEYVRWLPEEYKNFAVQEEDQTLYRLADTVLAKKHIPVVVLAAEEAHVDEAEKLLYFSTFRILDGLKRSSQLAMLWRSIEFFAARLAAGKDILDKKFSNLFYLTKAYSADLQQKNLSAEMLEAVIRFYKENNGSTEKLYDVFKNNYQWFEIWVGLSAEKKIEKTLVLNTGHAETSIKNQLELIFLTILPEIKPAISENFRMINERDQSAFLYTQNRQYGEFHFSHLLLAFICFAKGEALTLNEDLLERIQKEKNGLLKKEYWEYSFFEAFIALLVEMDKILKNKNQEKWLGKESLLTGLFAALGYYKQKTKKSASEVLNQMKKILENNHNILNLEDYARITLNPAKIKTGDIYKKAVDSAALDVIEGNTQFIKWNQYFELSLKNQEANV